MSDISNVSDRLGQSPTTNPATGYEALAREATDNVTRVLDKQLSAGAEFLEHASKSLRVAAAKVDERLSPLAHGLRLAARAGDDFAEQVRTRSPGELLDVGSKFARQRPLLVFGAAAGVGLLLSRFAKSTRETGPSTSNRAETGARSASFWMQTRAVQPRGTSRSPTL